MAYDPFNDDNDEDFEDMDEDAIREELRKEDERIEKLPVMKKAEEIVSLVDTLCDAMQADDDEKTEDSEKMMFRHMLEQMRGDSYILPAKIAGAEGGDLYSIRMENAVFIKKAASDIRSATYSLGMISDVDKKYLEMLRNEIDVFKKLFVEWIKTFSKKNDIDDGWGLWE
ncbi:MAG: hypothetical protein H7Y00_05490 [Fimbriimonadaceae bacterium]|nr:hypothetical protein [Chitinophagales bacterium]